MLENIIGDESVEESTEETPIPNDFTRVDKLVDNLIYDPSYIHKFKEPTAHEMIGKINELIVAVKELQQVVTNLCNSECTETRTVMNDPVYKLVTQCCDALGVSYDSDSLEDMWDGKGVLEEGIEAYK